jgi:hypothetical protein
MRASVVLCLSTLFVLPWFQDELGAAAISLEDYRSHVRTETWNEVWPTPEGTLQSREVTAEVWTAAFQAALDEHHKVHVPARAEPYYLDGPVVLKSGDTFKADQNAELRLKPGCNTCMVRNANLIGSANAPVPEEMKPDRDITIEGGIWSTLATTLRETNGNARGASSSSQAVPGTHGVILLQNVRNVIVRNVTVRQSKAFAVHLGNVHDFQVEGIRLEQHRRDGVHVNGPASNGVIRDVRGDSHDDTVSIAAWDWRNCAPSFGPIHDLLIEGVSGVAEQSADAIRLLPGVKRFDDGTTLDCSISNVVLRDITDIREFKFYDQPNLELGRDKDFSVGLGSLKNIRLERLVLTRPGVIQVAADVDGLSIDDVEVGFSPGDDFRLVEIGPMSQTYRHGPDPAKWVEIFSPDRDVTVRRFRLSGVSLQGAKWSVADAETRFVQVRDQAVNPKYPLSTPRGGTGKAKLVR